MTNHPYESVKCPECDGEMISRTGKFGVFWGCKNYPQCKGTRDNQGRSRQERIEGRNREDEEQSEMTSSERDKFRFNKN